MAAKETVDKREVNAVTPAKAGVQRRTNLENSGVPPLDPGFRRDDMEGPRSAADGAH